MRPLKVILGLLVLALPLLGVLGLAWHRQGRALGEGLVTDLAAAKGRVIVRDPPPKAPVHENGYQCLGAMLDVTPGDFSPFYGNENTKLNEFIDGTRPISELPPAVSARLKALSPWAVSMRSCADSAKLSFVDGLAPGTPPQSPRWLRLTDAIPAVIEFTALELRVLLADGQPEVALERCSSTWALAADQSHLGAMGAMRARMAVRRLAPACGAALAAAPPDVRVQVAKQWAPLKNRLASAKEIIERERLDTSLLVFAWVAPDATRARLPSFEVPVTPSLKRRFEVQRMWAAWDEAMVKLAGVAGFPGAERVAASDAVDATLGAPKLSAQYATFLASYEETELVLDLLTNLAADAEKPLPTGVTRNEQQLEYVNGQGQHLVIPVAKP